MEYIQRAIEDIIIDYNKSFKCILVTGARQTGKSTLIKQLFSDRNMVSFDDPFVEDQAREQANMFMMLNPPPVAFDEVQRAKNIFRYIKISCDENQENGLFCLTGSQPLALMKEVSESLSGRVGILELAGLSMRELQKSSFKQPFVPTLQYIRDRSVSATPFENIWEVIHRGSYPAMQNPDEFLD